MKVELKKVDATRMITIGPEHAAWRGKGNFLNAIDRSFIRLDPPHNALAEKVEELRMIAFDAGAVAIKVLPVRRDAVVVEPSVRPARNAVLSPRAVVERMVSDSRSQEKERLAQVVELALTAEGL